MNIGTHTFEEFSALAESFHGYMAPGLLIGGYMVAAAQKRLPSGVLYDALSETEFCLPDAVQLLTPCTVGNGWLRILNLGRYALTLYDKETGKGVRVYISPEKLKPYGEIQNWFLKLKPKYEQDKARLIDEIRRAETRIFGHQSVYVDQMFLKKREKGDIGICPQCREAYPIRGGGLCLACGGKSPYSIVNTLLVESSAAEERQELHGETKTDFTIVKQAKM